MDATEDSEKNEESGGKAKKRSSALSWLMRLFEAVFVVIIIGAAYIWHEYAVFMAEAPSAADEQVIFRVDPGNSPRKISEALKISGLVTDARKFALYARFQKKDRNIQAGTFLLNKSWTPDRVLTELVTGRSLLYKVTIREGLPMWEVADILEREGMCRAADFLLVISDADFLRHHGIPGPNAEGYLFPDTYLLLKPDTLDTQAARKAADRLADTFTQKTAGLWPEGYTQDQKRRAVILASIVEKETGVSSERPRVAGVYQNRLEKNMLLQADPTIIYGLGKKYTGTIYKSQLEDPKNPYNTYKNIGLPPGPICSPGLASLEAAVSPEKHDFLYFVATGTDKSHVFSKNLKDHEAAVRNYRAAVKSAK